MALESTIITHGMPYPENLETARSLESQVRAGGAIPATIAVMGGVVCAGLNDTELEWLAKAKDVMKLSRADLPYAIAAQKIGATTVCVLAPLPSWQCRGAAASRVGVRRAGAAGRRASATRSPAKRSAPAEPARR